MACACKTNKEIAYLHKRFGNKTNVSKKDVTEFRLKEFLKQLIAFLTLVLLIPFMLLHIIFVLTFKKDKTIKIKNRRWPIPIGV